MTVSVVFAIAGVIALLFGIVGGGIKAKEIEIPLLPVRARLITIFVGAMLIGFTIWLESNQTIPTTPTSTIAATSTSPSDTTSPLATSQVLPTVSQRIIFEEDFSANDKGWTEGVFSDNHADMKNEFINGRLRRTVTSKGDMIERTWLPNVTLQDFKLTFDAIVVDAPEDGVICIGVRRSPDNDNFYHIYFGVNGIYGVNLVKDGDSTTIYEAKLPNDITIKEGDQNSITIEIQGSLIAISVNDKILTTIDNSGLTQPGKIGLGIGLDNANETMIVEFDNLVVWSIP
jgi:hypothetical protein